MKTLFDLCTPRADVLSGALRDEDLAADLAQVINGTASPEYLDAARFFAHTHPTAGLKALLHNVCLRLSGDGGEAAAIFRLDTQYGGGKTHALIALYHAAQGLGGVGNVAEFVDPDLVPRTAVRVAAFDGENADPINGRPLGDSGLRAFTPWGELAFGLAGAEGYRQVQASDEARVAPGADTLRALFGGTPKLILLDELSIYLRKVKGRPDAEQLAPFLTSLFKAVETAPGAVLVFTLAVGKRDKNDQEAKGTDAYGEENTELARWAAKYMAEAASIAARKATLLEPTAEHEAAKVLRRRLFDHIDDAGAAEVVEAYARLWTAEAASLPAERGGENRRAELADGYPLHPALMSALTDRLSTVATFQRVRGMLRLMSRTVARVWQERDRLRETYALHLHHVDPAYEPIHNEVVTRLGLGAYDPAIRNDVGAMEGGNSLAQEIDRRDFPGLAPYALFVARTILWRTFAFPEGAQGVTTEELRLSILAPGLDPAFINAARQKFVQSSAYLDDRPGAPLRFTTEPNLTQLVRREEEPFRHENMAVTRAELNDRIKTIFKAEGVAKGKGFDLVAFPGGPHDVPDDVGDGPRLVVISYDAETIRADRPAVPPLVESIFKDAGTRSTMRNLRNHLVFLVADDGTRDAMKAAMIRLLALESLRGGPRFADLKPYQQDRLNEWREKAKQELAVSIQSCYRHLLFPSAVRLDGASVELAHAAFDVHSSAEQPGKGQAQVLRALRDNQKLLTAENEPLAPSYVRDKTPLGKRGTITTGALRDEFRKDPKLPILLGEDIFLKHVRAGLVNDLLGKVWVYRRGELVYGPGDPVAAIHVDEQSELCTLAYAKEHGIWPRPVVVPPEPPEPPEPKPPRPPEPPLPPRLPAEFKIEAPLKEAFNRVWEDARGRHVDRLGVVVLRPMDAVDASKLLSGIKAVAGADKHITLEAAYETAAKSTAQITFEGTPDDAGPIKEYLENQFRGAPEKNLDVRFRLTWADGIATAAPEPQALVERLARFATGTVVLEARPHVKTEIPN
jgi:hypothetical protein